MKKFYYILLIGLLVSCEEILMEEDITEQVLQLVAPSESSIIEISQADFSWRAVEGASSYQIQIASPDFQAPLKVITEMVEDFHYFTELNEGNYEWRVKGLNSGFETAYASAKFQVKYSNEFSDQVLALFSPPDTYISYDSRTELTWSPVEGAEFYRIQILKEEEVILEETTPETKLQVEFPEGEFVWKVRAENEAENTLFSGRTVIVDTKAPNSPELLAPIEEEEFTNPEVLFEWRREAVEGTAELDSLFIFGDRDLQELVKKAKVNSTYSTTLERDSIYYWYMKAYDGAGNQNPESEIWSLTIKK